ncbi:MAG: DUF5689 domain-containing protein [Paludibacteraceae bacterium]|nr:DUF5689 domain-containing protein [Paludibacteraceae bacterium]
MKKFNYILGVVLVGVLTACHTYGEPEGYYYVEEGSADEWKATMTIGDFLSNPAFFSEFGNVTKYPPRPRSYQGANVSNANLGLFSVEDIDTNVVIVGRIISTDVPGNIYKNLYIQDCANPDYAIKIGIDAGSVGGLFPIGQKIALKLKGLAIGKYAKMPQIGVPYYNNGKEGMDDAGKVGWEIGRIPTDIFKNHVQVIGQPNKSKIVVKEMTVAEIKATASDYKSIALLTSRLVRIKNITFVAKTWDTYGALQDLSGNYDCSGDGGANTFAPTTNGIGYPQSRCFTVDFQSDSTVVADNCLAIGTSEFAKFACAPLPTSEYKGTVEGMLSYYHDNGKYAAVTNKVWSLTLNGLESLNLENASHDKWAADPVYYPAY